MGRKFIIFALFHFVFEGKFQVKAPPPPRGLYSVGRFNGGFFALRFWGRLYLERFIHGGAYFRKFYGTHVKG